MSTVGAPEPRHQHRPDRPSRPAPGERSDRPERPPERLVEGYLELHPDGYGFLRAPSIHLGSSPQDVYVPGEMLRRYGLREGNLVGGTAPPPQDLPEEPFAAPPGPHHRGRQFNPRFNNGRHRIQGFQQRPRKQVGPRLQQVLSIEGKPADEFRDVPFFDQLTPVDPTGWLNFETTKDRMTTRVVDMLCPIGKGQRGLITAPPRSGKTILIQHIADAISTNHPDVELFVLLVDERPEEVTDMQRTVRGTVFASSNDRETSSHVRLAQLVIERAKRLVEMGRDVVVLLDSITRLARAYNKHAGNSGRTMTGGLDIKALDIPKRLFGSARAFDEGGSLTILGTALIETGSRMDDVIFEEFKGTGNSELVLDRKLAERRVWPAFNMFKSGTRKEERLLPADDLDKIVLLRRTLSRLNDVEAMETLLKQLAKHENNRAFLSSLAKVVG